jgi:hypothetical protein
MENGMEGVASLIIGWLFEIKVFGNNAGGNSTLIQNLHPPWATGSVESSHLISAI